MWTISLGAIVQLCKMLILRSASQVHTFSTEEQAMCIYGVNADIRDFERLPEEIKENMIITLLLVLGR